jgi:hypothetical protein
MIVGEAHAAFDATANFDYETSQSSEVSVGFSTDGGEDWAAKGSVGLGGGSGNSVSIAADVHNKGPYWGHQVLIPQKWHRFTTVTCQFTLAKGWYEIRRTDLATDLGFAIPDGGTQIKVGADIYGKYDGASAILRYYNIPHHHFVGTPDSGFGVKSGHSVTYTKSVTVFGFTAASTTGYDNSHFQGIDFGTSKKKSHDVYTNWNTTTPSTQLSPKGHYVFYSD